MPAGPAAARRIYGRFIDVYKRQAQTYLPNSNEYDVDNITLIAYAPYDDPQIAIGIIMEHGGKSVYAANVAKAIMDGYFHPETMPEVE